MLSRLASQRRGKVGALLLATLCCIALFAEWIAADLPLFMTYRGSTYVLPAITQVERFRGQKAADIARSLGPDDIAVWPLLRSGPSTVSEGPPLSGASLAHPLGTDAFGRDVAARLIYGARTALGLGLAVALVALVAGYALGAVAGLRGGLWDSIVERVVELVGVLPAVVTIALVRTFEGKPSLISLFLVMAAVKWAESTRMVRMLVLRSLAEEWAAGARAIGVSPLGMAVRHLMPHVAPALSVSAAFAVASVTLTETSLSFLGLGVPATVVSWGEMLGEIRWGAGLPILLPPLLALGLTLGALYLLADAVRTACEG
ncbi:MAG TPA: ABC transporter permease [Polyangiaceae bacterium]|jgi:peptide/nickel transport system permease protein